MPLDNIIRLQAVREAGQVVRCHVGGLTLNNYNNAQHHWGVAMICSILWPDDHELLRNALVHDVPERWLGDFPSTAIANNTALAKALKAKEEIIFAVLDLPCEHTLADPQWTRLRNADRLDLYLWTFEEERRGNREFLGFRRKIEAKWAEEPPLPEVARIAAYAQQNWDRLPETFEEIL